MIPTAPVGPLWGSEIPARAEILDGDIWRALKITAPQARPMLQTPTVGPLWGSEMPARAEIMEGDVWRAQKVKSKEEE